MLGERSVSPGEDQRLKIPEDNTESVSSLQVQRVAWRFTDFQGFQRVKASEIRAKTHESRGSREPSEVIANLRFRFQNEIRRDFISLLRRHLRARLTPRRV